MSNSGNIALAILSTCLFFAGDAFAQGEGGPNCNGRPSGSRTGGGAAQGIGPQETAQRMISNFDEDGDGALNMQELSNGLASLQQSMMQMQMQRQARGQQQMRGGQNGGNQQQTRGGRGENQGQGQRAGQRAGQRGQNGRAGGAGQRGGKEQRRGR